MKQQEHETVDYLISEETEEQDFLAFTDLALTDEQLAEVKGGPGSGWCTQCGGIYSNHNETVDSDDSEADDDFLQFDDLALTDEQLAEIKGGPGGGFSCTWCGVNGGNHNETILDAEEEDDFLQFADLTLTDEQLTDVKGGPGWCTQCGGIYSNHNETTLEDGEAETASLEDLADDDRDTSVKIFIDVVY